MKKKFKIEDAKNNLKKKKQKENFYLFLFFYLKEK